MDFAFVEFNFDIKAMNSKTWTIQWKIMESNKAGNWLCIRANTCIQELRFSVLLFHYFWLFQCFQVSDSLNTNNSEELKDFVEEMSRILSSVKSHWTAFGLFQTQISLFYS